MKMCVPVIFFLVVSSSFSAFQLSGNGKKKKRRNFQLRPELIFHTKTSCMIMVYELVQP